MSLALLLWASLLCCWALPAFAEEATGIIPNHALAKPPHADAAASDTPSARLPEGAPEDNASPEARENQQNARRFPPLLVLNDLLRARQSAPDGMLELQYPSYLTHALLLSHVEARAHDLHRLPLHRFTPRMSVDEIADVPLSTVGAPRLFHMFVLFTFVEGMVDAVAERLSGQCKDCAAALAAFRKASNAFRLLDSSKGKEDKLPVFFAVINVGTRDGAAISAIHPAMQLPVVMHLPPTESRMYLTDSKFQEPVAETSVATQDDSTARSSLSLAKHRIEAADFFARSLGDTQDEDAELKELLRKQEEKNILGKVHFLSLPPSHLLILQRRKNEGTLEQRLLQWANSRADREATYSSDQPSTQPTVKSSGLPVILVAVAVALCWLALKGMFWLRGNQWLIRVGAVTAYTLCCSGLVFSTIHSVPLLGYDSTARRHVFLAPSPRMQYMVEGLLLSCCSTVASLAALGLVWTSLTSRTSLASSTTSRSELTSSNDSPIEVKKAVTEGPRREAKWRQYLARASFTLLAVVMVFCCGLVMQCYRNKASWYAPVFWPNPQLPKGPIKVDWGTMF
ncbi:hypothetical protein Efla_001196 [Eimeria flavescens]